MKNISKIVLALTLLFVFSGCTGNEQTCDCPDPTINSQEVMIDINNQLTDLYIEKVKETVSVFVYDSGYTSKGNGSGFVYKEDDDFAYIMTNTHVVTTYSNIEVMFSNKVRQPATVIEKSTAEDVAILRISKSDNYEVATLGNSSAIERGEYVFTIGSPLGIEYASTITIGVVSGTNIKVDVSYAGTIMYLIQMDASLNPGNSGGPLYNIEGEVIGINTLKLTSVPGVTGSVESFNYAIPINFAQTVENALVINRSYSRPNVNLDLVSIPNINLSEKTQKGISSSIYSGLFINNVTPGGNAFNAGMESQTIITKVNDTNINILNDFYVEIYKFLQGDSITITTTDLDGTNQQTYTVVLN